MKYINYTTYTDTDPYEVLEMNKTGKTAKVRALLTERKNADEDEQSIGGFACHISHGKNGQLWEYTSNPECKTHVMTLRKNGTWQFKGHASSNQGCRGHLSDAPHKYYDYNF